MKKLRFASLLALGVVLAAGAIAQSCAPKAHSESLDSQFPKRFEIVADQVITSPINDYYGDIELKIIRDILTKQEFLLVVHKHSSNAISVTPLAAQAKQVHP